MNKKLQELKKLHKFIIHDDKKITDNKEWYRLARKETKQIAKFTNAKLTSYRVCPKCFA